MRSSRGPSATAELERWTAGEHLVPRLVLSMLLAASVTLAFLYLLAPALSPPGVGVMAQMLVVLAVPLTLAGAAVIGLPLLLLATRRLWLKGTHFIIGGVLVSAPAVIATAFAKPGGSVDALNTGIVPLVILGAALVIALLTWAVGVPGDAKR